MVGLAPGGTWHTLRVESDTARMLFLGTSAGVEEYVKALAEPALLPWLRPPSDGPLERRRGSTTGRAEGHRVREGVRGA